MSTSGQYIHGDGNHRRHRPASAPPARRSSPLQRAVINVSVTASASAGTVGTPITFTVTVTNPSNLPIQNVGLSFGDGTFTTLGPTGGSVSKTYATSGTFIVTATADDSRGDHVSRADAGPRRTVSSARRRARRGVRRSRDHHACPGTTYPKTCTTSFLGIGVRAIFTAGCNTGFGAGACTNAIQYIWNFGDGTTEITSSTAPITSSAPAASS